MDADLEISEFLKFTSPSIELLNEAISFMKQTGIFLKETRVHRILGEIFYLQDKYTEASETLAEARRQFLEIDDILGAAQFLNTWEMFFTRRRNTPKPLILSYRPDGNSSRSAMSSVRLNAYEA